MLDLNFKAYFAEFVGTFLFQLLGGSVANVDTQESWAVAATLNGIGLAACIYLTANISGGHLNPAVSIGLAVQGSLSWIDLVGYVIAQIVGAICGAGILYWFLPSGISLCAVIANFGMAYVAELIFTFMLAAMVIACVVPKEGGHGSNSPVAIGFVLFVAAIAIGGISGAYINPARLIAPSAVYACSGWKGWLLLFAQIPAGILAGFYGILMYGLGGQYQKKEGELVISVQNGDVVEVEEKLIKPEP